MNFQLYIEGEFTDTDRISLRLNKVVKDLQNINRRGGTFTYTVRLPMTTMNKKIFSQVQALTKSNKFTDRETFAALLLGPNGEILLDGVFKLNDVTDTFNGVLYSNDIFWAQLIKDKTLRDIQSYEVAPFDPFADPYGFEWYLDQDIDSSDIQFPLVAYGNFFDGGALDNYRSNEITEISVDDYLSSAYYLTIIRKIFADIGLTVSGQIFDDDDVKKWVMPFTGEKFSFGALGGARLTFGEPLVDPLNSVTRLHAGSIWEYICKSDDDYDISHQVKISNYDNPPGQGDISITVYESDGVTVKNSIPKGTYNASVNGPTTSYSFNGSLGSLLTGDVIHIHFVPTNFIGGPPDFEVDQISGEESWEITIVGQAQGIDVARNLPEINQKQFIGDFITMFNLYFEVKDKHIFFFSEEDFTADDRLSVDITSHVDNSKIPKILRDDVFKERRWKYSNQEDDALLKDLPELGNYTFVDDQVVGREIQDYPVGFSATLSREYQITAPVAATVDLPTISRDNNAALNEVIWEFDHTPRLIKYLGKSTDQIVVQGNNILYGVGAFTQDMCFEALVEKYYNTVQNIKGNALQVSAYLPAVIVEKLVQRYKVQYNGDLYRLASFLEYDPSRRNAAKLTLVKEVA